MEQNGELVKARDHKRVKRSLHDSYQHKSEMIAKLDAKLLQNGKLTLNEQIRLEKYRSECNTMKYFL